MATPALGMPAGRSTWWTVGAFATVAVLIRLTYLPRVAGLDEAGFLEIAQQWHGPGSSLYTDLWVDRPPLLIAIYQVGDALGGLHGIRVLQALVAGIVVLGTAVTANLLAGRRAAGVSAAVISAWMFTPAFASLTSNGEYFAAPFIVWSMAGTLAALRADDPRRATVLASLAGAAGIAAVMIKQNQADAVVFGLVAIALAGRLRATTAAHRVRVLAAAVTGAAAAVSAVVLLCLSRGTSPTGVLDAMYASRVEVLAVRRRTGLTPFRERFADFSHVWLVSGVLVLMLVALIVALRTRRVRPAAAVLAVTLVFGHLSVWAGGTFFTHYMVELLVPVALLAGLAATASRIVVPAVTGLAVTTALIVTPGSVFATADRGSSKTGAAMKAVAMPGDSIIVLYGRPGIVFASGMRPAYEHLFRLTTKVRDPDLAELRRVLTGDAPPTWIIRSPQLDRIALPVSAIADPLRERYREVGTVCGQAVLLLAGAERRVPQDLCA
jgi:hypothetical protein